jgi:hypothetical protein
MQPNAKPFLHFKKHHTMQSKKNFVYATALLLFAGFSTACEKDQDDQISTELDTVTTGIIAELSTTLAQDIAKLGTSSAKGQVLTTGVCGATQDTTIANSFAQGNASKTGTLNLAWTLNCNPLKVPTSVTLKALGSGSLDSKILSSSSESNGDFTMGGLAKSATAYSIDGTFVQIAKPVSKIRNETHFYSQIDATVSKLMVSKGSTPQITSGTVTFKVQTGQLREQAQLLVEGTIVFKGNKQATLTLNGKTYEIDLN